MDDQDPLKVLEAARLYALAVMQLVRGFPRRAPSKLRAQLVEAARSVGANIAEGWGRGTTAEKLHFSRMANGSLEESQEHLKECVNTHLIERRAFYKPWNLSMVTARMLVSMIARLEQEKLE